MHNETIDILHKHTCTQTPTHPYTHLHILHTYTLKRLKDIVPFVFMYIKKCEKKKRNSNENRKLKSMEIKGGKT